METDQQGVDASGLPDGPRGVWLRGETPKELVLSDGSRLRLESAEEGRAEWHLCDELRERDERVSLLDAERLAGEFAGYVAVRTRAEAEWLRAVSDWCNGEASRLEAELSTASAVGSDRGAR